MDVDLQLAFRERGFHTRLEPRSVVTHLRGASGGGSFALWHRNRELFFERWAALCARRPPDAGDPPDALLAAASRDAAAPARFAVLAKELVDAEPRLAQLLALWPEARVTLFTEAPVADAERLAARGVDPALTPPAYSPVLSEQSFPPGDDELRMPFDEGAPVCWLGGPAIGGEGFDWPVNSAGTPLAHVASIGLESLAGTVDADGKRAWGGGARVLEVLSGQRDGTDDQQHGVHSWAQPVVLIW